MAEDSRTSRRRFAWRVAKWVVLLVVLGFVTRRAVTLWRSAPPVDAEVSPGWLVAAGGCYLIGWLPAVVFWRHLLAVLGEPVAWWPAVRAYYCGHLGKYIPGKAMVLVIRGGMVGSGKRRFAAAALTAAYETLTTMAAGLALGLAILPMAVAGSAAELSSDGLSELLAVTDGRPWLAPLIVAVLTVAALPLAARVCSWVAVKMTPAEPDAAVDEDDSGGDGRVGLTKAGLTRRITARTIGFGVVVVSCGWVCHAASLACVLQALGTSVGSPEVLLSCLAAVCVATTAGFAAIFAPGGLGVREGLLIEILSRHQDIDAGTAVLAAVLLRLVWFLSEIIAAGLLYSTIRPTSVAVPAGDPSTDSAQKPREE